MKTILKVISVLILSAGACMLYAECGTWTESECVKALENSHWQTRHEMLMNLRDCPVAPLPLKIQNAVIGIVDREVEITAEWNEAYRMGEIPSARSKESREEEYGFYIIALQQVLFSIKDNPDAMDALLLSMSVSNWNIYKRVIDMYGEKLVPGLVRQFNNEQIDSLSKRRYLYLAELLGKSSKLSLVSHLKLKDLVVKGLDFNEDIVQEQAIETAVALDCHDDGIIDKIEKISSKRMLKRIANESLPVLRAKRVMDKSVPVGAVPVSSGGINVPLSGTTTEQVTNHGEGVELQKSTTVQ